MKRDPVVCPFKCVMNSVEICAGGDDSVLH